MRPAGPARPQRDEGAVAILVAILAILILALDYVLTEMFFAT